MEQNDNTPESGSGGRPTWLIVAGFGLVLILIIVGLFLLPISLGDRLGLGGDAPADSESDSASEMVVATPEGVALSLSEDAAVSVSAVAPADLATVLEGALAGAAAALPERATVVGDAYVLEYSGAAPGGRIALPLPADAASPEALDLFGWDGDAWAFVPNQADEAAGQLVAAEGTLPQALLIAQVAAPETPIIAAEMAPDDELAADVGANTGEISVGALLLGENGSLAGELAQLPETTAARFLRVTNRSGIVDQAALTALLDNVAAQDAQINSLAGQAKATGLSGVHIDYQGVPTQQEAAFTSFIERFAEALHAQDLLLAVTLGTPAAAGSAWDTGGQNWANIGRAADVVFAQMPLDPSAYGEGGLAEQLLTWATDQIDRRKLSLALTTGAIAKVGETFSELAPEQALGNFGELSQVDESAALEPGSEISFALTGPAGAIEWDGTALAYRYETEQNDQPQTVWFVNEAALNERLQLAREFGLRGAAVRNLGDLGTTAGYGAVISSFLGQGDAPQPAGAAIAWTVRDESDSIVASETGSDPAYTWTAAENPGNYRLEASLVLGDAVSELGALDLVIGSPEVAEAEEEPAAEATPEEDAAAEDAAPADEAVVTEAPAERTAPAAGTATAVVNVPANVRVGPGLGYGTVAGGVSAGSTVQLIGRSNDASWLNVTLPDGQEGWILASLMTVSSGFEVSGLEVVEVAAPAAAVAAPGGSGTTPAPAPAAPPPAPVGNVGNFELGGQAAGMPAGTMQYAGMSWVKKQHKWHPGDSPDAVAGLINEAHAAGLKILLSIPGELNPSSINFEEYTNFLGGVAALGPNAIEVWNEMNIDREWPAGQINPTSYVNNMLRPAYQKIKAANPNVMVITGAPAPTGFFNGCGGGGCDDAPYVAGMMAAGAGSVSDCVGVHYNEGIMPPAATTGDPRGSGEHYTRYFQGMINAYTAAGAGQLCFTELGYLSGQEWGSLPAGFLWRAPYNLTVAEHAQYLAEAVSVAVNSGRVRMMIVFNVDFTTWGSDPQAGYAMIRPDGSCPACETLRSVMGN